MIDHEHILKPEQTSLLLQETSNQLSIIFLRVSTQKCLCFLSEIKAINKRNYKNYKRNKITKQNLNTILKKK